MPSEGRERRLGHVRLGVLGGTFNPIHRGHLHLARSVRSLFSLSRVLFVVAAAPPHKPPKSLIALAHRYAMVCLATAGDPSFVPSLVELEAKASPYSVDTMRKITRGPGRGLEVFFIAGGDSLRDVHTWQESGKLLSRYNIVFVNRPGVDAGDFREHLPEKVWDRVCDCTGMGPGRVRRRIGEPHRGNRLFLVECDAPDISATAIRRQAASGGDFRAAVPGPVHDYIQKLRLYGDR